MQQFIVANFKQLARLLVMLLWATAVNSEERPLRVVSMNLCTDQLAMLVAAPGQLISVSQLAANETSSAMASTARQLPLNRGLAEQIIRLHPDLVIAGTYSTRATVNLLQRLGIKVATFEPAVNFAVIRLNLQKMGELLGNQPRASALVALFDQRLQRIRDNKNMAATVIGSYGANSYTGGIASLEHQIINEAGFEHLASQLQLQGGAKLPIESLIRANPDILMSWQRWSDGRGRALETLQHPALDQWFGPERQISVDSRYWTCGTPYTIDAIQQLQAAVASQRKHYE